MRLLLLLFLLPFCVSSIAQSNPADDVAKARQLSAQHKEKEAFKVLKDAVKKNPDCSRCYLEMGFMHLRMQNIQDAMKSFDNAANAGNDTLLRAAAHRYKGLMLLNGDKKALQQAESEFRQALALQKELVEAHFNLAIALLRQGRESEGLAEMKAYLDAPGKKEDEVFARKVMAKPILASETIAPDFTVQTVDGRTISLTQNEGKIVVIDFWATWCPPCRASVPEIKDLVKKYPGDKLLVISASADNDEKVWREFIAKKQMTWPQYHDKDGKLAELFQVQGYPTYVVIDREGFILKRLVGMNPQETISHQLKAELKSLLE